MKKLLTLLIAFVFIIGVNAQKNKPLTGVKSYNLSSYSVKIDFNSNKVYWNLAKSPISIVYDPKRSTKTDLVYYEFENGIITGCYILYYFTANEQEVGKYIRYKDEQEFQMFDKK